MNEEKEASQLFLKFYLASIPFIFGAMVWFIKDKFRSQEQRVSDLRSDMELHLEKALSDLPALRDRVSNVATEVISKYSELERELRKTLGELEVETTKFELLSPVEQRKKTESLSRKVGELTNKVQDSHDYLNIKVDEVHETISSIEEKILKTDENIDELIKKELKRLDQLIDTYHIRFSKNLELIEANLKNIMSVLVYVSKNNEAMKSSQLIIKRDIERMDKEIWKHSENFKKMKTKIKLR